MAHEFGHWGLGIFDSPENKGIMVGGQAILTDTNLGSFSADDIKKLQDLCRGLHSS
jgi:hypothetical protein